jgi:RNA 2',3'-cyclic 3'-phosphodiesterase
MTFRSFISIDIGAGKALSELCNELRAINSPLKVVDPNIMHITLKFLGEIEERQVPSIVDAMRASSEGTDQFNFSLEGMGAFPNRNKIRVVWVGIVDPGPLGTIARRLDDNLAALGFEKERRRFKPHLTVARAKSREGIDEVREIIDRREEQSFGSQTVESLRLKRSVLGPRGPTYHTMEEAFLTGNGQ